MKKVIACLFILQTLSTFADQTTPFSLTVEEMVFASKLSDENRRQFCYKLSPAERLVCLGEAQKKDDVGCCDEIVEGLVKQDSLKEPILR